MKMQSMVLFLLCLPLSLQAHPWGWFNHGLSKLNFRSHHIAHQLDKDDDIHLCEASVEEGSILSLRNVWALKNFMQGTEKENGFKHGLIRNILQRHHNNAARAAYEVKCTIAGLATGIVLYRNRYRLGKRWEEAKDTLAGMTLVWGCYKLRHRITNGYTNLLHAVRGATS